MVLEGAMVVLAAISLTAFHPGLVMRGVWSEVDFKVCCCGGRRRAARKQAAGLELSEIEK